MTYSVVFKGKLVDGVSTEQVRANLEPLFRNADGLTPEAILDGDGVEIKTGLDRESAERYQSILLKAGLVTELRDAAGATVDIFGFADTARSAPIAALPPLPPAQSPWTVASPEAPLPPPVPAGDAVPEAWWIVEVSGARSGPYARGDLIGQALAGRLDRNELLWQAGMMRPIPAGTQAWLDFGMAAPPPPSYPPARMPENPYTATVAVRQAASHVEARPISTLLLLLFMPLMYFSIRVAKAAAPATHSAAELFGAMFAGTFLVPLIAVLIAKAGRRRDQAALFKVFFYTMLVMAILNVGMAAQNFGKKLQASPPTLAASAAPDDDALPPLDPDDMKIWVEAYNKRLPKMVNDSTRMDSMESSGKVLIFSFTLLGEKFTRLDAPKFDGIIRPMIVKKLCTDKWTLMVLKQGYSEQHVIYDENRDLLANYTISQYDCLSATTTDAGNASPAS